LETAFLTRKSLDHYTNNSIADTTQNMPNLLALEVQRIPDGWARPPGDAVVISGDVFIVAIA